MSNAEAEHREAQIRIACRSNVPPHAVELDPGPATFHSAAATPEGRQAASEPSWKRLLNGRVTLAVMDGSDELHPVIRGLKTICRCNNIKYKTIERAIREGAWTLNQVAARTTATTGECGGSCTPEVQEMIAELAPRHATRERPPNAAPVDAWWVKK